MDLPPLHWVGLSQGTLCFGADIDSKGFVVSSRDPKLSLSVISSEKYRNPFQGELLVFMTNSSPFSNMALILCQHHGTCFNVVISCSD